MQPLFSFGVFMGFEAEVHNRAKKRTKKANIEQV